MPKMARDIKGQRTQLSSIGVFEIVGGTCIDRLESALSHQGIHLVKRVFAPHRFARNLRQALEDCCGRYRSPERMMPGPAGSPRRSSFRVTALPQSIGPWLPERQE